MSRLPAFESPSFQILWFSSLATAGAQFMERVATGWLALETGGGPLAVGVVLAARTLPSLLLGLAAGTLADRRDRRRLLMAVALAGAGLAVTLGVLVGIGAITFWHVAAIAFLSGCIQVSDTPARQSLIFDTVGREATPNAIALNAVASRFFGAVGALAGGLAIPTIGTSNCYFIVAASYLVGLLLLTVLRVPPVTSGPRGIRPSFRRAFIEAGRLILDRPAVRTLVLAAMTCEIFAFSFMTVVPTFARDVLRTGAEGLGALSAASAIGATIAVLLLAGLVRGVDKGPRREPLLAAVYVLYGLGLLAFAVAPGLPAAILAMLVVGGCSSAFDALQQTMIQLAVPEDQRGRAVGVWVFSIGTAPVGHVEIGAFATLVGAPTALLVNAAFVLIGAFILIARAPAYRWRLNRQPAGPIR